MSILHPTLTFTIQQTDKQALSHTYRQMDRRSCHYSVRFLCKTTTMSDGVRDTHARTQTCARMHTSPSIAVIGKTAQLMQSSSSLTGIKWPLHRGSHACVNACTVHAQRDTQTVTTGGQSNIRQQESWTRNLESIHKTKTKLCTINKSRFLFAIG